MGTFPPSAAAQPCGCPHCGTVAPVVALFQDNPQPMWVFDRDTLGFLEVNAAAVERYGYTRDEFLSMSALDIRPPEDEALLRAELQRWTANETRHREWRHVLKDGTIVDVAVSARAIQWGERPAAIVTVLDLTPHSRARRELDRLAEEQRIALDALRRSEERFSLLAENIPQVFWISEAAEGVIYVSPHFESMFGMSADAMLSGTASLADIMEPEDVPAFLDASERQRRGETTVLVYRIRHPDGSQRFIEDRAFPVPDEHGRVDRIAGIAKDVTERRNADRELELERVKLQLILDNLPVMVAFFNPSGGLVLANRCLRETLGWSGGDDLDLDMISEMHPDPADRQRIRAFIRAASGEWGEFDTHAADGSVLHTAWAAVKLPDGSTIGIGQDMSELYRSEHERRTSEARFRLIVEGSEQVLFYVHDLDGRFEYVSPSALQLFGYAPEELVGSHYATTLAPDSDIDAVNERTETALDTGVPQPSYQVNVVHRDGRRLVMEVTEEPITRNGEVVGIQGFGRDITSRVAAEAALRDSEERLHAIVNTVTEGLVIVSAAGNIEFANPAAERILGLQRADLQLRVYDDPAWRITDVEGQPLPHDELPFVRVMRSNAPVHDVEHGIENSDGRRRILSVNAAPMRDARGVITGVVTSVRDVTERRRAEHELAALHARLVAIVDTSPLAIVMVDPQGLVQVWNRAAERIFGWASAEVVGRPSPVRSADGSPVILDDVRQALAAEPLEGAEVVRLARDGRTISLNVWTAPLRNAKGELSGLVFVIADVSDRKHLEEQLRQAQKLEAVGRLAGGVAHDFNNVLTSILGHADLLLERLPDFSDDLYDDIAEIRRGAERARSLTQQLLAFSRKQIVQPRVLNAAVVLQDMWRMLTHLVGENVRLEPDVAADVWPVLIDRGQLEQVLLNLVVNARDAMSDGGSIRISLANATVDEGARAQGVALAPGEYVVLNVTDTGSGIDPAVLPYIFEPFFTTKELGKGTGLGLATVYGVMAQNGGSVVVDTEPGAGSTFRLHLPRAEGAAPADAETVGVDAGDGSETILLVEDEPAVRSLATRVLERRGYTVLEAASGAEALAVVAAHAGPIHLVLTDMVMPGMSGRELVEQLGPLLPDTPVMYMSGYTDEIVGGEDGASGALFLAKPFAPAGLTAAVRSALAARHRDTVVD